MENKQIIAKIQWNKELVHLKTKRIDKQLAKLTKIKREKIHIKNNRKGNITPDIKEIERIIRE